MFNDCYTFNGTEEDLDKAIEKAIDKAEPDDYTAQIVYYIVESLKENGFEVKSILSMAAVMLAAAAQVTKMAVPVGVMFVHQV